MTSALHFVPSAEGWGAGAVLSGGVACYVTLRCCNVMEASLYIFFYG